MDTVVNYWGVLISVLAALGLGMLWYGPLFGKQWMRIVGISHEQMEQAKAKGMSSMWRLYALQAVSALVMAYVLAHVIAAFSGSPDAALSNVGVSGGLWMWIGFVAPPLLGSVLWERRPWKYWFITSGYYLVTLIVMGIIITSFQ
jgi:hypothetical protein